MSEYIQKIIKPVLEDSISFLDKENPILYQKINEKSIKIINNLNEIDYLICITQVGVIKNIVQRILIDSHFNNNEAIRLYLELSGLKNELTINNIKPDYKGFSEIRKY